MSELPPPAPRSVADERVDAPVGVERHDAVGAGPPVGSFTRPWRVAVVGTWVLVILAYAAVWKTSEELGIGTWWLGTRSDPSMALVRLIPFAVAAVPAVAATYNVGWAWWASLGSGLALVAVAIPDFSRSTGLALLELAIALAALLVTVSARAGRYRVAAPSTVATDTTPEVPESSEG